MRTDTLDFPAFLDLELTERNRGLMESRCFFHFGLDRQRDISALLDLILKGDAGAAERVAAEGAERLYLDALVALVKQSPLTAGHARPAPGPRISEIGEAFDILFEARDERDWGLVRCLNFLYRAKVRPNRKCAIVTSIRDEGINLLEWIAHHRLLGIDDFLIYVNDNDDGSSRLLDILAEHGVIHVIWNRTALGGSHREFSIQMKTYGHACDILPATRQFEWLMFSDVDEFLVTEPLLLFPEADRPLDDLFICLAEAKAAAVAFSWKWFGSFCEYRRRPGLIFERFQHWSFGDHVKTIARSDRCLSFGTSHLPRLVPGDLVLDGTLEIVAEPGFRMSPKYGYGQLNHYYNKSFEEFVFKHLRSWGLKDFSNFFDFGGNRTQGRLEAMPAAWIRRLRAEIERLRNLPGVADEVEVIETAFSARLAAFDSAHDITALYQRHLAGEKN